MDDIPTISQKGSDVHCAFTSGPMLSECPSDQVVELVLAMSHGDPSDSDNDEDGCRTRWIGVTDERCSDLRSEIVTPT